MRSPLPLTALFETPMLGDFSNAGVRLVAGLRRWAYAADGGEWPVEALRTELGCPSAAAHVQLLVEELAVAWPDPFCLSPPCCRRASHDEALLAAMLGRAAAGDQPGFDRLCADLLGCDARERLFVALTALGRALAA